MNIKKNKYQQYEAEKRKLQQMNLSPAEYERMLKEVTEKCRV